MVRDGKGQKDRMTMKYVHVGCELDRGIQSPADTLKSNAATTQRIT